MNKPHAHICSTEINKWIAGTLKLPTYLRLRSPHGVATDQKSCNYKIWTWSKQLPHQHICSTNNISLNATVLNSKWYATLSMYILHCQYPVTNGNKQVWKLQIALQTAFVFRSYICELNKTTHRNSHILTINILVNVQFLQELYFTLNLRRTVCIVSKSINKQLQTTQASLTNKARKFCLRLHPIKVPTQWSSIIAWHSASFLYWS